MKPSKLEIERDRLYLFAELLRLRAGLLHAGVWLSHARRVPTASGRVLQAREYDVVVLLEKVWAAQQACIEYELKYPLERR